MLTSLKGTWTLVLGVSSGMGRATARALAAEGANVIGLHFDTGDALAAADELRAELTGHGVEAHLLNLNAASAATRREVVPQVGELTGGAGIRVLVHSIAFGSLLPYLPPPDAAQDAETLTSRQMAMTVDVMGHSLVYWTQDLFAAGLLPSGAKVFGLTSSGGSRVMASYGAVSAAKAALEAHLRQLAVELAPHGVAANAIRAGTTLTPALEKIPGSAAFAEQSRERNPHRRLTTPEDVAEAIVLLSGSTSSWITGNVIGVDGGEALTA